jgi:hypothetical protein
LFPQRVAAVQWEFGDAAFVDDLFQCGTDRFHLRDGASDGDGFRDLPQFEHGLDLARGVGIEPEGLGAEGAKAVAGDLHAVLADRELRKGEAAIGVGDGGGDEAGAFVDRAYGGAGDYGAGLVLDRSGDLPAGLGEGGCNCSDCEQGAHHWG